jgi:hypothetical protein
MSLQQFTGRVEMSCHLFGTAMGKRWLAMQGQKHSCMVLGLREGRVWIVSANSRCIWTGSVDA